MKKLFAAALAIVMSLSLVACGEKAETPAETPAEETKTVYAVEAGSAGEAVALENGFEVISVDTQAKALMEVQSGTSDAAIIDSLMAAASVGEGTSYENLTYTIGLNSEEYGVGFRKGSDLRDSLNEFLNAKYADGTVQQIAETYGVQGALVK
jgi:polar amino acid transport system substrate-binding protein